VEYHNLRNYQLPLAEQGEAVALAKEAKSLISFVGSQLREWMVAVQRPLNWFGCMNILLFPPFFLTLQVLETGCARKQNLRKPLSQMESYIVYSESIINQS